MKTLFVHIGLPKTATTSIQKFCCQNEKILEKYGYCYPRFPWKYTTNPTYRNGIFLYKEIYKDGVRQLEEEDRRRTKGYEKICQCFETFDHVILSDEIIWHAMYSRRTNIWQELNELGEKQGFQVRVLVYLRRQDEYISSWWNQIIKAGAKNPPTGYEETPWEQYEENIPDYMQADYYDALERIANIIGKENIIVRVFERDRFYGGMIEADFLHCLGLELTDEYSISEQYMNQKLSGNTPEMKRILNSLPDMNGKENNFIRSILNKVSDLSETNYPCSVFSREEASAFVSSFEEGNQKIAKEYLSEQGERPLFSHEFKDTIKWERDNPYFLEDIIRFIGESDIILLHKMEEQQRKQEAEIRKLKKELNDLKDTMKHPVRFFFRALRQKVGTKR